MRDRRISKHLQSREEYDSKLAAAVFEFESHEASNRDPSKTVPGPLLNRPAAGESSTGTVAVTRHGQCFEAEYNHIRDFPAAAGGATDSQVPQASARHEDQYPGPSL